MTSVLGEDVEMWEPSRPIIDSGSVYHTKLSGVFMFSISREGADAHYDSMLTYYPRVNCLDLREEHANIRSLGVWPFHACFCSVIDNGNGGGNLCLLLLRYDIFAEVEKRIPSLSLSTTCLALIMACSEKSHYHDGDMTWHQMTAILLKCRTNIKSV